MDPRGATHLRGHPRVPPMPRGPPWTPSVPPPHAPGPPQGDTHAPWTPHVPSIPGGAQEPSATSKGHLGRPKWWGLRRSQGPPGGGWVPGGGVGGVGGCQGGGWVGGHPDAPGGPVGIEPQGNVVLKPAQFTVETLEAGVGEVLVYVEDPEGHTEEVGGVGGTQHPPHGVGGGPHLSGSGSLPTSSVGVLLSRLRWSPTMTRRGRTVSPTCPRLGGCTR